MTLSPAEPTTRPTRSRRIRPALCSASSNIREACGIDAGRRGQLIHTDGCGMCEQEPERRPPDQILRIAPCLENLRRHAAQQLSLDTSRVKVCAASLNA